VSRWSSIERLVEQGFVTFDDEESTTTTTTTTSEDQQRRYRVHDVVLEWLGTHETVKRHGEQWRELYRLFYISRFRNDHNSIEAKVFVFVI
jgi:hypothetical protein